jgi:hypothetical protein
MTTTWNGSCAPTGADWIGRFAARDSQHTHLALVQRPIKRHRRPYDPAPKALLG